MILIQNFIDGQLRPASSKKTLDVYEPRSGKIYAQAPLSEEADVLEAIHAAKEAFLPWSRLSKDQRAAHLRELAALILKNMDELVLAESRDNGKPVRLSKAVDIPRSATNFEYFANLLTGVQEASFETRPGVLNLVRPMPLGVVSCISPWNLPLYLFTWKIAPALAAGNTVVAKPSEVTPMTAYLFSKIVQQSSLPKGVLNIIHGTGAGVGSTLTTHPDIKAVSFTGSTATGGTIAKLTAPLFKKVSLEMGGKNATLIFEDANLERTVSEAARASFANQGQICLCGSRILIHESIYQQVKERLVERAQSLVIGDPLDPQTQHGALVSKEHLEKVMSYIELAKKDGARILCGGERLKIDGECEEGYFLAPTLIEGLAADHPFNQEEIFGPVASLIPFSSEEEAIKIANSTIYGLAFSVWTENVHRAHRVSEQLEAGIVWVNTWMERDLNTPFGGMKASGVGREGGLYALNFFREMKTVCLNIHSYEGVH
jgi:aminomuconate-semialdehyde/2-hydroxymuconate-6-semialdehyde dehydrogenase